MNILILDKNPQYQKELSKQIVSLGNEVYISASMCNSLKSYKKIAVLRDLFSVVIFSESISDQECYSLLNNICMKFDGIIRISSQITSDDAINRWKNFGFTHWINALKLSEELGPVLGSIEKAIITKYPNSFQYIHLSNLERKFLTILVEEKGNAISREKLCERIWETEVTAAKLSYLSMMAKNIRLKYSIVGYPNNLIMTIWKRGYKLNLDIYSKILKNEEDY